MALKMKTISGNEVRVPDPELGQATVVSRYGKTRAMLIHPTDFDRLNDFDHFLTRVSQLEPLPPSPETVRAHREEDTPGKPITDPAILTDLFG